MKTKCKIALCVVFIFLFSLVPLTAFAYTDNVSASTLVQIAKDSNKDMYSIDSSHSTVIYETQDTFNLVITSAPRTFTSSGASDFPCTLKLIRNGTQGCEYQFYTFPKSNVYDCSNKTVYFNEVAYTNINVTSDKAVTKILYSNRNIYINNTNDIVDTSTVFFQQMSSIPTSTSRAPLNTVLSSTPLSGILDELIAMLPTLLPILITFIAVRKGIAFILTTLRSA